MLVNIYWFSINCSEDWIGERRTFLVLYPDIYKTIQYKGDHSRKVNTAKLVVDDPDLSVPVSIKYAGAPAFPLPRLCISPRSTLTGRGWKQSGT